MSKINYGFVSVIMPSYNSDKYIEASIKSVLAQSYSNLELIIVDDCSTDDTYAIVRPYLIDSRIRYLKNEVNSGAAICRNRALRESKGKWIAFLDSDDLWLPEKLEKQLKFMVENGYHFSYTEYEEIDDDGSALGVLVSGPRRITRSGMNRYCWPGCLTVMYDAEKVGLVQIVDIQKNNDYALWLKVCWKADCWLLKKNLARYRKRQGSISRHSVWTMIKWHYRMWREAELKSKILSMLFTAINMANGAYKKIVFVKRIV